MNRRHLLKKISSLTKMHDIYTNNQNINIFSTSIQPSAVWVTSSDFLFVSAMCLFWTNSDSSTLVAWDSETCEALFSNAEERQKLN